MGAPAGYYGPFAEALSARAGVTVVLLDLRGQGRSTMRARCGHQFDLLVFEHGGGGSPVVDHGYADGRAPHQDRTTALQQQEGGEGSGKPSKQAR